MLDDVLMVTVTVPPAVTDVGLNVAVAPVGRPLALKVTVCAVPLVTAVVTVAVVEPPASTAAEVGAAVTEWSLPVEEFFHAVPSRTWQY